VRGGILGEGFALEVSGIVSIEMRRGVVGVWYSSQNAMVCAI
jgi:hypothetical protein